MDDIQKGPEEKIDQSEINPEVPILEKLREEARIAAKERGPDIAGFWRRWLAFIIDGIFIGAPLWVIAIVFGELFYALGPYGRFIGYSIFIPYIAYFNSKHMSGQTFGKRIMKIAVVNYNYEYLNLQESFTRAFILSLLLMLNGWALSILQNPILSFLVTIIVFGGTLSMIYALVFNRTTRQGIHDLISKTYVVKVPPNTVVKSPQIPKIHYRITLGLFGVGLLIAIISFVFQIIQEPALELIGSQSEWQAQQDFRQILIDSGEFYTVDVYQTNVVRPDNPIRALNIELWSKTTCYANRTYCDDTVEWVARLAFEHYDHIENLTDMRVVLKNQQDLGFLSGTRLSGAALTIEEWQIALTN